MQGLVLHGHTPFRKRGKGSGNFRCSRLLHRNFIYSGISFTRAVQALWPHNYLEKTDEAAAYGFTVDLHLVISYGSCGNSTYVTEYCTVIGPALHSARQQTAVKLPDPFPLLQNGVWPRETMQGHAA